MDTPEQIAKQDPFAAERKQDHIQLAFQSQVESMLIDKRFNYEPALASHPATDLTPFNFAGKTIRTPIWVSSMTGGTEKAYAINANLARACNVFGMGMGLGSCRVLLESDERLRDFDFRKIIGDDLPFYTNIGIAQLEYLIESKELYKVEALVKKLDADGVIIHINPLQEWLQPEGDKIKNAPVDTLKRLLDSVKMKVIVKEVGQGMGPQSLKALMQMPFEAIEFAAHGGTNFSKLELLRAGKEKHDLFREVSKIGHSAEEMTNYINTILSEAGSSVLCKQFIISGGIKNFLDGYYLMEKLNATSVYGQASALLQYAEKSYEELEQFLASQVEGLKLSKAFFKLK